MQYTIVADSSCDMTPELRERFGIVSVPLNLLLGEENLTDDDALDVPAFVGAMKTCTGKIGSAAPSPELFREAFVNAGSSFAVTLSRKVSSTYQSAVIGARMAKEEGAETFVFDSMSASAGEILTAVRIRELEALGLDREGIIREVGAFIRGMKTYFVLDSVDNFVKNGRMSKLKYRLVNALDIKPLLGSDGAGEIAVYGHTRGSRQVLQMLTETVAKSGLDTAGRTAVICHCCNPTLAEALKRAVEARYSFKEVLVVPMRGLSSLYANDRGIIIAF